MALGALQNGLTKQGVSQGDIVQLLDNLVQTLNSQTGMSLTLNRGTSAPTAWSATTALATLMSSTSTEVDRHCDVSARMVAAGSTLSVTVAAHDGKIIQLDTAAGSVCTLPAASGSGARFEFVTTVLATSNSHIVKVANATDIMVGRATVADAADDSQTTFVTTATSDTITFNRTTSGSVRIGERIVCVDVKTGFWAVDVVCVGTGGEATPFSASVS